MQPNAKLGETFLSQGPNSPYRRSDECVMVGIDRVSEGMADLYISWVVQNFLYTSYNRALSHQLKPTTDKHASKREKRPRYAPRPALHAEQDQTKKRPD